MDKNKTAVGILLILLVSPFIGIVVPWLHYFIPIAIAFNMPIDGPPFSETVMPIFAFISIVVGVIGFLRYLISKGNKALMLMIYGWLYILYSCSALLIWLLFFGARFFKHFPIKEVNFYIVWGTAVVPHILWILVLIWCDRRLKSFAVESQSIVANKPASPDEQKAVNP